MATGPTKRANVPNIATHQPPSVTIHFHPDKQNAEAIQAVVADILRLAGCANCGRLSVFDFDFLVNPAEQLAHGGAVTSVVAMDAASVIGRTGG